tara:strand:+ start:525 stop:872 length:348 start_codon:yes stop_codon:yes gene_type:complete
VIKYINILGSEWSVFWFDNELPCGSDDWGLCYKDKRRIEILNNSVPEFEVDTFLHEVMHAVWYEYKRSNRETEENAVAVLSAGLINIFKHNPEVLAYLTKNLNGGHDGIAGNQKK